MFAGTLTQMQSVQLNSQVITFRSASTMCLALCWGIGIKHSLYIQRVQSLRKEASTQHVVINPSPCPYQRHEIWASDPNQANDLTSPLT